MREVDRFHPFSPDKLSPQLRIALVLPGKPRFHVASHLVFLAPGWNSNVARELRQSGHDTVEDATLEDHAGIDREPRTLELSRKPRQQFARLHAGVDGLEFVAQAAVHLIA